MSGFRLDFEQVSYIHSIFYKAWIKFGKLFSECWYQVFTEFFNMIFKNNTLKDLRSSLLEINLSKCININQKQEWGVGGNGRDQSKKKRNKNHFAIISTFLEIKEKSIKLYA